LARAILDAAAAAGLQWTAAENTVAVPGKGITAVVEGQPVWLGNRRLAREQAKDAVEEHLARVDELEQQGQTVMFVGVADAIVGRIAGVGGLRPGPAGRIGRLRDQGTKTV